MIGSVLKIDFRHFWRNRFSFLVSISGLCVGIISVVLILLFLEHEITYDQFFPRYPDLYRISRIITYKGEVTNIALTDGKLETILEENVPEIQNATKFIKVQNDLLFKKDTESYVENNGLICDVDFLQVLTFKLHSGDEFGH